MRAIIDLVLGSPKLDDKSLIVHLVAKTVVVAAVLLALWALQYQANVVYEGF
jgi:hypothetical protein